MRYQLVLQFPCDSLTEYDQIIALEDRLTEDLGPLAEVDGHDCGSGEMNIFIITTDPAATFGKIRQTLKEEGRLAGLTAAYRDLERDHYTVLWPQGSAQEFKVA